jgi:DNA-binding FadR family transcriptional regulator
MRRRRRHNLHFHVICEIGQQIISGKFPIGQPIPAEAALCAMLDISRTALREALIVLASKGLVEARQKIGTIVRPREEWNMLDADLLAWRVESPEGDHVIAELYELRKLIEPLAASLAASRATRRDVERLRKAYDDMVVAWDDGEKVLDPDMRFHRGVIAAAGNSLFASLGILIAAALEVNFKAVKESPRGHAWALPLHEAVLDAIASRDPKAARVAMLRVLDSSEQDLRELRSRKTKRRAPGRTS